MEHLCNTKQVDAIIMLGDNFYPSGVDSVDSVDDPQWQAKFEQMYGTPCLKDKRFYAVLGNHDYRGNAEAQIEYTEKSGGRWNMPARYYSVLFGDFLELIALDSTYKDYCEIPALCSIDWAVSRSKESKALWRIMVLHNPVIFYEDDGQTPKFRDSLAYHKLACESDVDMFLSGDTHNLQFLHGSYGDTNCEVKQLISGSGGSYLNPVVRRSDKDSFAESKYGVLYMDLNLERAEISCYRVGETVPVYTHTHLRLSR